MSGAKERTDAARPHHGGHLTRAGLLLTALYLAGLIWYSAENGILALTLADLGSFLGGALSPLALAWVVLGFFQQGQELKNSVQALELQSEELRRSVEQQKALVDLTREQFEHEREARQSAEDEARRLAEPILAIQSNGSVFSGGHRTYNFTIVNAGATCTNVRFEGSTFHGEAASWPAGTGHSISFTFPRGEDIEPRTLEVRYLDARGQVGTKAFLFTVERQGEEPFLRRPDEPL